MDQAGPVAKRDNTKMKLASKEQGAEPALSEKDLELQRWVYGLEVGTHSGRKIEVPKPIRYEALDLARGFAICLMILSHGIKGLMTFEQMPDWGLVPIHLITKFSSSLFILVFGMTLAVSYVPFVESGRWPEKRKKLLLRGFVVFFWYKALTILEMSNLFGRDEIWAALTYKAFPVYVEILGFYAIALLWIPWVLPLWKKSPAVIRLLIPIGLFGVSQWLSNHPQFFTSEPLQALLVEHPDHYTWGQLSRAPLVFVGLLIGWLLRSTAQSRSPRLIPFSVLIGISISLFSWFLFEANDSLNESLVLIAKNAGKHPPELQFMLFSLGGAFLILSFAVLGGKPLSSLLGVITSIGRHSLQAFIFHIVILFVFYRYLFDYFHKVEYGFALFLSLLLISMTSIWVHLKKWVKENS